MNPADLLLTYAFIGVPVGLLSGLALGLVANRDRGWGGYASFRRRAARLGHVALVMLPLIAGFYAMAIRQQAGGELARWGAYLWIAGGVLLAATLFAAAWRRSLRFALPLPATALTGGAVLFALSHLNG